MSIQEFENLRYASKEVSDLIYRIKKHEEEIAKLQAKVEKTTQQLTGMPRGSSGQSDAIAILIDRKMICESELIAVQTKLADMERIIAEIPDSFIRMICRYKYIDHKSWSQTARAIGGNNTADGCRMAVSRYFIKKGTDNG